MKLRRTAVKAKIDKRFSGDFDFRRAFSFGRFNAV